MVGDEDLDRTLEQCGVVDLSRLSVVVGRREGAQEGLENRGTESEGGEAGGVTGAQEHRRMLP